MDTRFFGDSMPAHRALLHYLIGDYPNAARWYRVALAASIVDAEQRSSWGALRARPWAQSALAGVNAGVVGLLLAALIGLAMSAIASLR